MDTAASLLGVDVATNDAVTIEQAQRLKGLYVIGKTGSGKTTLLVNLILQDIQHGMGVCFLDTHGDALTDILRRLPAERESDVVLLDLLDDEYAFGLNLFACADPTDRKEVSRITAGIMDIFAKLFTESGDLFREAPTMAETLQNLIPVFLVQQQQMSLAEVPLFLMDITARTKLLATVNNPLIKSFWESFSRWKTDRQENLIESTRRRVSNFLGDPLLLHIVGQTETTVNFRQIMDEGKILLVRLSREHPLITSLVGSMIVSQIANAAFSRATIPEAARRQFNLYADEYQRFATPTFAELLTEVRKYKIATCVAHQARGQLDYKNRVATLNAANLVVFAVSGEDAQELAQEFDTTPIRKKQILKQRTEPVYKEWNEWVWTDEAAHEEYDQLPRLIYEAEEKQGEAQKWLSYLAAAIDHALFVNSSNKAYASKDSEWSTYLLDELVAKKPQEAEKQWHKLFIPPNSYFDSLARHEPVNGLVTRSGLVKRGTPHVYTIDDIYTEEEIWQYHHHRTAHYERRLLLFRQLVVHTDFATDIPPFLLEGGSIRVYEEAYLLQPEAVNEVALVAELKNFPHWQEELKALLLPLYENKLWWFTPDPKCVHRVALSWSYEDTAKRFARDRGEVLKWMNQAGTPPIGQERPPADRYEVGWSAWGRWNTEHTFPTAVAWLREKVRTFRAEIEQEIAFWQAERQRLEERQEQLKQQYYVAVPHKEYLGEQPAKEPQTMYVGERPTRYGTEPRYATKEVQWYDLVEELDQTPSERRDEIANELANPKQPFTAWAKLGAAEHVIRIPAFSASDPETLWQDRRERIIQQSRQTVAASREAVEEAITWRQAALMQRQVPKGRTTFDDDE